jgi:hypothetical protein
LKPVYLAHLCLFFGSGTFAGGAVALIHDAELWITLPLLILGAALQTCGFWIHWRLRHAGGKS